MLKGSPPFTPATQNAFLLLTQNFLTLVKLLNDIQDMFHAETQAHFHTQSNHPFVQSIIIRVTHAPHNGLHTRLAMVAKLTRSLLCGITN